MKNRIQASRPSVAVLEAELIRMDTRQESRLRTQSALCLLAAFVFAFFLAVTLWFPIFQVHGNSMSPTLWDGDILLCVKSRDVSYGDITLFYHNNRILVKRLIGTAGDTISLDADGHVTRNNITLTEDYVDTYAVGNTDIPLPCRVPAGSFFLMGDHRETSLDSRNSAIGCIPEERILGKAVLRIWPLRRFGSPDG